MVFERGEGKDYIVTGNLVVTGLSWYNDTDISKNKYVLNFMIEGNKISFMPGAYYGIIFVVETTSGSFEVSAPNDGVGTSNPQP